MLFGVRPFINEMGHGNTAWLDIANTNIIFQIRRISIGRFQKKWRKEESKKARHARKHFCFIHTGLNS